jgi:hypothetical protein
MRARGLASGPTSGHHFICAFWPFHFCRSALIVVRAIARWRQRRRNVVEKAGSNRKETARILGTGTNTLWRKLRVYRSGNTKPR